MMLLSFSETNTSLEPASAHFLAQSALSMSLAPHFSSLTQPLILVSLGALSLARDAVATKAKANTTNSSFFIGNLSPRRILSFSANCVAATCPFDCSYGALAELKVTTRFQPDFCSTLNAFFDRPDKAISFPAQVQRKARKRYRRLLRGGHTGVSLELLFQWFPGHSLKL